jgi:hypothetical protein
MLVLNKQAALDRMITLAERQSESVPEPFTLRPVRSLLGPPPAWEAAPPPREAPVPVPLRVLVPAPVPSLRRRRARLAAVRRLAIG